MASPVARFPMVAADLTAELCHRAVDARDPRFDGLFYVGITTTRIYCRPVCPARVSHPERRRFFGSAAAAERDGFRPCLRCRPELAPGRAAIDAISQLARAAERRIAGGALNGRGVADLARELGVSERHLRRALEREIGVSPVELAQTHRLLLAKRLLTDTTLSVTQVAYASGFQSLRRFNAAFRDSYRLPPSRVRRPSGTRHARQPPRMDGADSAPGLAAAPLLWLTLAYRPPLAWDALLHVLARDAVGGVDAVRGRRYARTVSIDGHAGVVLAEDAPPCVRLAISSSLVPVLMPLLARLRHLLDLDAEPTAVDAHLAAAGLSAEVGRRPGLRVPGAVDGFDAALRALVRDRARPACDAARRTAWALGEPIETGFPELSRLAPSAARVAEAGAERLIALGVPGRRAAAAVALARVVADGRLRLEPGSDPVATRAALADVTGADDPIVDAIVMRALGWPDAFPASERGLQRAAGAADARTLRAMAERWRPWRSYAALHLRLSADAAAIEAQHPAPVVGQDDDSRREGSRRAG